MTAVCDIITEPCQVSDCDGLTEVIALLPSGPLWDIERGGVYARYIQALGDVKTELNRRLCAVWGNAAACTANREGLAYWAGVLCYPPCMPLTADMLCKWQALANDASCAPGTLGFIKRAIAFVLPGVTIGYKLNVPDIAGACWCADAACPDDNALVLTVPGNALAYETVVIDAPYEGIDPANPCRAYYVPQIECLRSVAFPLGLSVGYKLQVGTSLATATNIVNAYKLPNCGVC